jgi:hypothetical protein
MGTESELALDITRRDGTLELTSQPRESPFSRSQRVQVSYLTEHAVAFGTGEQYVSFTRDPSGETLEVKFAPTPFPCVYPCDKLREITYRMRRVHQVPDRR